MISMFFSIMSMNKMWSFEFLLIMMNMYLMMNMMKMNMMYFSINTDFLSKMMIIMTMTLMMIFLFFFFQKKNKIMFMILTYLLMKLFLTKSMFEIYFFFELSLYPLFFIVSSTGSYINRTKASMYLFFYTFMLSIPFLIYIINNYMNNMNSNYLMTNMNQNSWFFIMFFLVMLVKMPIFLLHFWLPKAHVESSVYGSMILAGLILKISGYMMIRWSSMFFLMNKMNKMIFWMAMWGAMLMSLYCLSISDFKMMIAYSSIAHMSMMLTNYFFYGKTSYYSIMISMFSHAFVSSSLFFSLNSIYERTKSKSIIFFKSMIMKSYFLIYMIFMLMISNFGFPPMLSFFSEMILITNTTSFEISSIFPLMILMFFFSMYNMIFFFNMTFGKNYLPFFLNIKMKEMMNLMTHLYFMSSFYWFMVWF